MHFLCLFSFEFFTVINQSWDMITFSSLRTLGSHGQGDPKHTILKRSAEAVRGGQDYLYLIAVG